MRRKNGQIRTTEFNEIQKKLRRITVIFLIVLSVMTVGILTGCRDKNASDQSELVTVEERQNRGDSEKENSETGKKQKEESEPREEEKGTKTDTKESMKMCYVHVCGAVNSPGVYKLTSDSRLFEAIQMAGGLTADAAGESLNQAEPVEDGSRIYVPTKDEVKNGVQDSMFQDGAPTEAAENQTSVDDGKVDINTAAKEELMTLSGIGEAKAEAIIRYREEHGKFRKIEDLMGVEGIKEGVFQKVKDQIKV